MINFDLNQTFSRKCSSCNFITGPNFCLRTPYSTVLLEELTGSQEVKKFPAFYGTRMFITEFTSAYLSLGVTTNCGFVFTAL